MTGKHMGLLSWRKRMGWTQKQAANALDVSVTTYQTWENQYRYSAPRGSFEVPKYILLAAAAIECSISPIQPGGDPEPV